MKKPNKVSDEITSQNFSFLGNDNKIEDIPEEQTKPESVPMTQSEFEKGASHKKELFEFLETENIYMPH